MTPSNLHLLSELVLKLVSELLLFLTTQWMICITILITICLVTLYLHLKRYQRNCTKNIPMVSGLTFLRFVIVNRRHLRTKYLEFVFGVCSLFEKEGMWGIRCGPVRFLFLYSPEAVKFVLGSRTILNKGKEYEFLVPLINDGMLKSSSDKWRTRRKLLTPSFHFRIIEDFLPVFNRQAKILVETIDDMMKKETSINMVRAVGISSLNSILEIATGTDGNISDQKIKSMEAGHKVAKIVAGRILQPWLWSDFIFRKTEEGKVLPKYVDVMNKLIKEVIGKRQLDVTQKLNAAKDNGAIKSNFDKSDKRQQHLNILDLMLNLHLKDNSLSLEDVADEVKTFLLGAHETTALSVSWTLYLLGFHPHIQREVQDEIDMVLGNDIDRIVTTEDIRCLKYLHCAFKETLRLHPPGSVVSRTLEEDTVIDGYKVRKGTSLIIPIHVVHRNPKFFPNPEVFIPNRFSEQYSQTRHPYVYIPFSAGPRNCIGQKYAASSALILLATILRHFSVTPVEHRDKIQLEFGVTIIPENGLHLRFSKRQFPRKY